MGEGKGEGEQVPFNLRVAVGVLAQPGVVAQVQAQVQVDGAREFSHLIILTVQGNSPVDSVS